MPGLDTLAPSNMPGDPSGLFGQQQIVTTAPGTLPARWYTLFGVTDAAASAMKLQPTADQVKLFQQMSADPKYASIFKQSGSMQNLGWEYSNEQKQLVQQAAVSFSGGQIQQTPEAVNDANTAADPYNSPNVQKMFALEARGFTAQEAQDTVLGTGAAQVGVIGGGSGYLHGSNELRDVNPGVYGAAPTWHPGMDYNQFNAAFEKWVTDTQAAATNYGARLGAGIQNYYASIGADANGISQGQISANDRTYASIQDPAQQVEWLSAQDPGNLSAGLRDKWTALVLPGVQVGAAQNKEKVYMGGGLLSQEYAGQIPGEVANAPGTFGVTLGSVVHQDEGTGRLTEYNNVATGVDYSAPEKGSFSNAMDRLGGATFGGMMGFISSFGNPLGAVAGAAQGSGALGGLNGKNLGTWKWGQPQKAGGIGSVATSMAEAMAFSELGGPTMGKMGRFGLGSALGSINAMINGGSIASGGVEGGFGGLASGGAARGRAAEGMYYFGK